MDKNAIRISITPNFYNDGDIELVERRGIGHPDTICDGLGEVISHNYSIWCKDNLGFIPHHNFDKILLSAGETDIGFGTGILKSPIKILVGGRATKRWNSETIPIDFLISKSIKEFIHDNFLYLKYEKHIEFQNFVNSGSKLLSNLVADNLLNDTTFCFSHWPTSILEELSYQIVENLNTVLKTRFPIGEDVKVNGIRVGDNFKFTVAVPFISTFVKSAEYYIELKTELKGVLENLIKLLYSDIKFSLSINLGDRIDKNDFYLTLTGTSAESGDDGSIGRGNRSNSLVTPFRPTGAPPSGKNPISHPGKIYNIFAIEISKKIVKEISQIDGVEVCLMAEMGRMIDQPTLVFLRLKTKSTLDTKSEEDIQEIIESVISKFSYYRKQLLKGAYRMY